MTTRQHQQHQRRRGRQLCSSVLVILCCDETMHQHQQHRQKRERAKCSQQHVGAPVYQKSRAVACDRHLDFHRQYQPTIGEVSPFLVMPTGPIPVELSGLKLLTKMALSGNQLTGEGAALFSRNESRTASESRTANQPCFVRRLCFMMRRCVTILATYRELSGEVTSDSLAEQVRLERESKRLVLCPP